jgi:hypothetical protein
MQDIREVLRGLLRNLSGFYNNVTTIGSVADRYLWTARESLLQVLHWPILGASTSEQHRGDTHQNKQDAHTGLLLLLALPRL